MLLKTLYNKMIQLGIVLHNFCRSVILLVVKNASKSLNDLSNYRPVSVISIIAKTHESLVCLKFGHLFTTHVNQFGFSTNGGVVKQFLHLIALFNTFGKKIVMFIYVL